MQARSQDLVGPQLRDWLKVAQSERLQRQGQPPGQRPAVPTTTGICIPSVSHCQALRASHWIGFLFKKPAPIHPKLDTWQPWQSSVNSQTTHHSGQVGWGVCSTHLSHRATCLAKTAGPWGRPTHGQPRPCWAVRRPGFYLHSTSTATAKEACFPKCPLRKENYSGRALWVQPPAYKTGMGWGGLALHWYAHTLFGTNAGPLAAPAKVTGGREWPVPPSTTPTHSAPRHTAQRGSRIRPSIPGPGRVSAPLWAWAASPTAWESLAESRDLPRVPTLTVCAKSQVCWVPSRCVIHFILSRALKGESRFALLYPTFQKALKVKVFHPWFDPPRSYRVSGSRRSQLSLLKHHSPEPHRSSNPKHSELQHRSGPRDSGSWARFADRERRLREATSSRGKKQPSGPGWPQVGARVLRGVPGSGGSATPRDQRRGVGSG